MTVRSEPHGAVLVVTIDRPEARNSINPATADALAEAFKKFDTDDVLRVAVLTGAGGTFCSGADLKEVGKGGATVSADMNTNSPMGPTRILLTKPVIAAIEGWCVAGGVEMAAWCDLRVASREAKFGLFGRRFGAPLVDGGSVRIPRLIGYGRAMDLILTGREVDAEEALRIGLIERVVDQGMALDAAVALADEIASFPQGAVRADRRSVVNQWGREISYGMAAETAYGREVYRSGEVQQGAQRFVGGEGRHGRFGS